MDIQILLSFLIAASLLTLMPGPDILLVITESITNGKKYGVSLTLGLCSGIIIHTTLAASGLAYFLKSSPIVFTIITYFGAAYLLYLAYQTWFEKEVSEEDTSIHNPKPLIGMFKKGFIMNVLNPKVTLFFIAFLPQFITKDGMPIYIQMLLLGIVFMIQAVIIMGGVAILAGKLKEYIRHPRFWIVTKYIKLSVLIGLAIFILIQT